METTIKIPFRRMENFPRAERCSSCTVTVSVTRHKQCSGSVRCKVDENGVRTALGWFHVIVPLVASGRNLEGGARIKFDGAFLSVA